MNGRKYLPTFSANFSFNEYALVEILYVDDFKKRLIVNSLKLQKLCMINSLDFELSS